MKRTDRITAIVFIIGSIFLLFETSKIKALNVQILSSKMFPQLVLTITILLAAILFMKTFTGNDSADQKVKPWATLVNSKRLAVLVMFVVYLLIIPVVGFLPSTAVFVVIAILGLSPQKKKDFPLAIVIAGGLVGVIYLVFSFWLQVFLP